jgi:transcriptional activator of cad operon
MLRFAPFAIDVQRHVRMRGGETVDLSPRLVDILGHLASLSWSVISKEALLDRFWADVHVTDNTLTWSVTQIRKALADEAANPTFIQTVARRGYRFVAPVDASGAPPSPMRSRHG